MGRPGLLAKARPRKASSIEARQYSRADTRVEYTRLAGHKEGGREFIVSPPRHHRCLKEATSTSRRCSRGGIQHETKYGEGNKREYT